MSLRGATILVLVPGRATRSIELDRRLPWALTAMLVASMAAGATANRCLAGDGRCELSASDLTGSLHALRWPEYRRHHRFLAVPASLVEPRRGVKRVKAAPAAEPEPSPQHVTALPPMPESAEDGSGVLRLNAVHLGEMLKIHPFDDAGSPLPKAFGALEHLMRCRISGEEVPIDQRLIRILTRISDHYDRTIQLISGHRKPFVIGTKPTSQHALGRAADIRVPGVGIKELRDLAIRLGARGVGLYPEKGFVHVDVREKPKYFWKYSEEEGEEADLPLIWAQASLTREHAHLASAD